MTKDRYDEKIMDLSGVIKAKLSGGRLFGNDLDLGSTDEMLVAAYYCGKSEVFGKDVILGGIRPDI